MPFTIHTGSMVLNSFYPIVTFVWYQHNEMDHFAISELIYFNWITVCRINLDPKNIPRGPINDEYSLIHVMT